MPDRSGQLSSFPASLDQFIIKQPYDNSLTVSEQNINSLETADHFNHMFDAIYNIETHALEGSGRGIGGVIVSRHSGANADVYSPYLKMAQSTLTMSMSGTSVSATAMVPSSFGTDPFNTKGFSIAHTTYFFERSGSANIHGLWANTDWGNDGPNNTTFKPFQFFTMIKPVSGRVFEIRITNIQLHTTSETISPIFADDMDSSSTVQLPNRYGWTGTSWNDGLKAISRASAGEGRWRAHSEKTGVGGGKSYGWVYPTNLSEYLVNCYVEWGEITQRQATVEDTDECYSRVGFFSRGTGTINNYSMYAVVIGDVPHTATLSGDKGKYARILKITGGDLTADGPNNGGGTTWASGSITNLSSGTGYLWFGDTNTRYRMHTESVPGSAKITIEKAIAPSYNSWTTLYGPFYDGSSPLASGRAGIFAQSMNGEDYRWVEFRKGVTVTSEDGAPLTLQTKIMFLQVTPEGSITMESGS